MQTITQYHDKQRGPRLNACQFGPDMAIQDSAPSVTHASPRPITTPQPPNPHMLPDGLSQHRQIGNDWRRVILGE
jgi:hypothetical protein